MASSPLNSDSCKDVLFITKNYKLTFLIILVASVSPLNSGIYYLLLPYLDNLYFSSCSKSHLIFIPYIFGFAISQLLYGPLSDYYGRKPVILGGILILCVGILVSITAKSFYVFFISRILQGVGTGYSIVMSRSIQKDVFFGRDFFIYSAYISTLLPLIAIISPLISGVLISFYPNSIIGGSLFLFFYSLFSFFFLLIYLPETLPSKPFMSFLTLTKIILSGFKNTNSKIVIYFLIGSLLYANEIVIYTTIPLLLKNHHVMGLFSHAFSINLITLTFIFGGYISYKLNRGYKHQVSIFLGINYLFINATLIFLLVSFFEPSITICYLLILSFTLGVGITGPNVAAFSINFFPTHSGFISSLYSSGQFFMGMLFLGTFSIFENNFYLISLLIFSSSLLIFISQFFLGLNKVNINLELYVK